MESIKMWFINLFSGALSVPKLAIYFSIIFGFEVLLFLMLNGWFSTTSKIKRVDKRMSKFFKLNSTIHSANVLQFKRRYIKHMPKTIQKSWLKFEKSGKPIANSDLKAVITKSSEQSGVIGFVTYLYSFIAIVVVFIISTMVGRMDAELCSVYICGTLALGSAGLILLAVQLYLLDKHSAMSVTNVISEIYSRMNIFNRVEKTNMEPTCFRSIEKPIELEDVKCEKARRAENFEKLDVVIAHENNVAEENYNQNLQADAMDRIIALDKLVEKSITQKVSKDLLALIRESILAINDTGFLKPIDQLRMKGIINKLDNQVVG